VILVVLVSCDDGGSASGSSGNPYRVTYHAGEGAGVPPFPQVVRAGHIIELPGQETMTHPSGKALSGWKSSLDGIVYNPYDRYPVYADVDFTAQWGTPPKLSAPTGVTTAVLSPTSSVRVTWNTVYGATSYDVYYQAESSTSRTFAGNISSPPFTNNGLQPNTTYYYYVKAKNSDGESAFSQSASVKTPNSNTGGGGTNTGGDNPGTGTTGGTGSTPTGIDAVSGLANKLSWLQSDAQSGGSYTVEVNANETIGSYTLSYSGKSNITITLKGIGSNRMISYTSNTAMFDVNYGVTLVLDNNITLMGYSGTSIRIDGGSLIMNSGSTISGGSVGGVFISGGSFNMSGGTISGNTASFSTGGGVYCGSSGFTKTGSSTIYGYSNSDSNSNVTKDSSGKIVSGYGHAVFAGNSSSSSKFKDTTAGPGVDLSFDGIWFNGGWDN